VRILRRGDCVCVMSAENAMLPVKEQNDCSGFVCPLNLVKAGTAVRIKRLCVANEVATRLREMGFCEDAVVRLVTSSANIICLVCSARLALSEQLAQSILVEPIAVESAA